MSISSKIILFPFFFFFILSIGFSQNKTEGPLLKTEVVAVDSIVQPISSSKKKSKPSFFDQLSEQQKVIDATLITDLNKLKNIRNKAAYWDGKFILKTSSETTLDTFDVDVRLRGVFRLVTCDFPPLKLKFMKDMLKKSGLRKRYNKMKLVTHCIEGSNASKSTIFREYLAYKLFNIVNEFSFRTVLVKMKYFNSKKKRDKRKGYAILIEDSKEVEDRIGGKSTNKIGINDSLFNKKQEQLTSLFQFMIANTDWSTQINRNVKLIENEEEEVFAVPYDFDFSGFVYAPYARLTSEFGQTSLKDRVFLGDSKSVEELQPAIDVFLNHKTEILAEIANFDLLDKTLRKELGRYIKSFFTVLENPEELHQALFERKK